MGQAFEVFGLAEFDLNSDFLSFVIGFLEVNDGQFTDPETHKFHA